MTVLLVLITIYLVKLFKKEMIQSKNSFMYKKISIIVIIIVVVAAVVVLARFLTGEDTWICVGGQWIKHGNPSAPMPTSGCGTSVASPTPTLSVPLYAIQVFSPESGATLKSPVVLEGRAHGSWFFEASAPVKILDAQGRELAHGNIQAIDDWMTDDFVRFRGEISFNVTMTTSGVLVFNNDNPSGLPENSSEFRVPVVLSPEKATLVNVYFSNNRLDPEVSCNKVFEVEREIAVSPAPARLALEELLKGPTDNEKAEGFLTGINSGVKIQSLSIQGGVAKVDFDETLEQTVGGSCRVAAIRAQITQTLEQFSTVKSVIISINGRTEDILQP